jgi:hypothetical protein
MTNEQFIKITKADADVFNALSKAAILILIRMRFYAGANGEAYPSKATLADDTGLSIGSIKRGLKELKEADLITLRSARRTSTNIWEIRGSKIDQKGIISKPKGIENDPLEDQKRSIGGSKMILEGIENDPLSRSKKEIKEIDPITSSTKGNFFADNDEIDLRDLWLGELWAKHAIAQGWSSGNVQGDFDKIKEGMSVLQVSKAVRKLDAFIVERNMAGIYMGTSWFAKIRDRWVGKETDKPATKYELEKMRHSTINVSREAIEQIETAAQDAQEAKERADAVAMSHQSKAHQVWAKFRSLDDYEACINACTDWYKSGACTADMLQEIQTDPALSDFNAIIITSQY